ncbi:MAG: methylated-DNA--[protein]-cysteine S-methyltransferase [Actinomycetota bacterium]|nr:methylated-DNA--[protein]-cysteine S-methyltransferase [Actinomycetota bacterium]
MKYPTDQQITEMLAGIEAPPETIMPSVLIRTALADEYTTIAGPLGLIHVAFTTLGVTSIVPTPDEAEFLEVHQRTVGRPTYATDFIPKRLDAPLQRALKTARLGGLPVDLRQLTPFQREVLDVTATIPPGEVRPYGWVAREMGSAGAVRAVGSALGRNPVPIVIPCHRVVRSDGAVGNYAFGSSMKMALLEHEGMEPELFAPGSLRYVGSDTTRIFCYPTCRNARRITERHRVEFARPDQAEAKGYRACKVCRPG